MSWISGSLAILFLAGPFIWLIGSAGLKILSERQNGYRSKPPFPKKKTTVIRGSYPRPGRRFDKEPEGL
jgi:hypothetical protein